MRQSLSFAQADPLATLASLGDAVVALGALDAEGAGGAAEPASVASDDGEDVAAGGGDAIGSLRAGTQAIGNAKRAAAKKAENVGRIRRS